MQKGKVTYLYQATLLHHLCFLTLMETIAAVKIADEIVCKAIIPDFFEITP